MFLLSFAEKEDEADCFQSKAAEEEACVAVKIEHSTGRQSTVTQRTAQLKLSRAQKVVLPHYSASESCCGSLSASVMSLMSIFVPPCLWK